MSLSGSETVAAAHSLPSLLIQTGHWNRTDVSLLYEKSLWEQLCMSIFACYEILIPPPFFPIIPNNPLSASPA